MYRNQVEDRIAFTRCEKQQILAKSNGKCAHCGRSLSLDDGSFTIEHIIPISKGGTNDFGNLLGLCYDCNQHKNNLIMHPLEYYKYIDAQYVDDMMRRYDVYQTDQFWLSCKNYFPVDSFLIRAQLFGNPKHILPVGRVCRMTFDDIPLMIDMTTRYHKKYNLNTSEIEDCITTIMKMGAIYGIYIGSNLVALLPIRTMRRDINDKQRYIIEISGIPCAYQKQKHRDVIFHTLLRLVHDLALISPNGVVGYTVSCAKDDRFLVDVLQDLSPVFMSFSDDDEFVSFLYLSELDLEREHVCPAYTKDRDKDEKLLDKNSKWLQRAMKLREIKN